VPIESGLPLRTAGYSLSAETRKCKRGADGKTYRIKVEEIVAEDPKVGDAVEDELIVQ